MRFMAAPSQTKHRPAFTVEKLDGEYPVKVYEKTETGLVDRIEMRPRGYLVTFLKGHSIHVASDAEMKRLKLNEFVPIIDTESGEEIPGMTVPVEAVTKKPGVAATASR